jgi:predicted acyltransferase
MRQISIDYYRGATIALMLVVNTPGTWSHVFPPLLHAPWHGCTPTDLVFPSFLFIVGVSMWFSFKKFEHGLDRVALAKIGRRSFLLVFIGMLLAYYPFFNKHIETLRLPGVLQRIGVCYGIASVLCVGLKPRMLIGSAAGLLLGYWAVMYYFALPGTDPYGLENNAVRVLDRMFLGDAHIYKGEGIPFDPEGILSTFPAVVTVLLGWWSGQVMDRWKKEPSNVVFLLLLLGVTVGFTGLLWDLVFPINKKIWTSSYVLYAGGLSMIFLSFAYWLLDVRGSRAGAGIFLPFGANPLFAYVLSGLLVKTLMAIKYVDGAGVEMNGYKWVYQQVFMPVEPYKAGSLLFALVFAGLVWLVCAWLYRKKIMIKI